MRERTSIVLICGLAVAAAARAGEGPETAPTPYTADQIREGCPVGRRIVFEVEAAGQEKGTSIMEFIAAGDDSATIRSSAFNASDEPVGKPSEGKESWEGLRRHAAFPKEKTTIEETTITVPAGTFACKLYTVAGERDGRREVRRFHFANELPGPPVKMTVEVDGEVVHAVTMLESGSRVKEE